MDGKLKYHHLGVPVTEPVQDEVHLDGYHCYYAGFGDSEFGIELMRYEKECTLPEIVRTKPHIAFEVDSVRDYIRGRNVIIEPNSPSEGVVVAFIEENGVPVELIEIRK